MWSVDTDNVYLSLIKFDLHCACFYQIIACANIVDRFCNYFIFSEGTIAIDRHITSLGIETPVCFKLHRSKLYWVFRVSVNITKLGEILSETRKFYEVLSICFKTSNTFVQKEIIFFRQILHFCFRFTNFRLFLGIIVFFKIILISVKIV